MGNDGLIRLRLLQSLSVSSWKPHRQQLLHHRRHLRQDQGDHALTPCIYEEAVHERGGGEVAGGIGNRG